MHRPKSAIRSRKTLIANALMERLEGRWLFSASAETPFLGTPFTTNQTIPFVDYDKGGSGVAYHDTTAGNKGNSNFRPGDSVDIETGGTSKNVIGYTAAAEWLNYTVKIATAGVYTLQASVANVQSGASFHASVAGKNLTGALSVPATANWNTYKTIASPDFSLSAGTQILQIYLDKASANAAVANLDWFKLVPSSSTPTPPATGESPFLGAAFTTSENIPFADYDLGGSGIAFHSTTSTNPGNDDLRDPDPIGVEAGGTTTGDVLGYTYAGEWLQYTINIATAGSYELSLSVANPAAGAKIHASIGGVNLTGSIAIPNTGSWNTYETVTSNPFNLAAGKQIIRITMDTKSSDGALGNFDYFQVVPTTTVATGETPYQAA
ncbi:MAG TPA: carbohydrate-binding protein, partial [Humisphaera sp.]|nr:carbohydrate-binding protein [Humisphaera sp.]